MSAPKTNIETQKKRHRWPLLALLAVVLLVVVVLFLTMFAGSADDDTTEEIGAPVTTQPEQSGN